MNEKTDDPVLSQLLDLTLADIHENRPLFPNPLQEPVFYRKYFRRWVLDGLEEAAKINDALRPPAPSID